MAKLCSVSIISLFLALLHSGLALHCYESTCLNDLSINSCVNNNRTVLKECNIAILTSNLRKLQGSGGTYPPVPTSPFPWTCVKHTVSGTQNTQATKLELKLCFPDTSRACAEVEAAAKGLDVLIGQQMTKVCNVCTGDSCNPAYRPAASSLVALVAATVGMLLMHR